MDNAPSIDFSAIKHIDSKELTVIWDLGRRCTYDCTYCTPHYHTNFSPFVNKEQFFKTAENIIEYGNMLNQYRKNPVPTSLSFTGGEPTITPGFFEWTKQLRNKYPSKKELRLGLTTNGCYNKKNVMQIIENFNGVTISYHAEATKEQKSLVLQNIETCKEHKFSMKVNLMMHKDYWQECVDLADYFKQNNIRFVPRIIGDGTSTIESPTTQVYNNDQMKWFKNYWQEKNEVTNDCGSCNTNTKLGRPCCRQDTMDLKINDQWQAGTFVPHTNFNQWHCMINWFFLHVNSEFNYFTFHQTCEVNINNKIGGNGKLSEMHKFTSKVKNMLETDTMPIIKCPKMHCGCGLCASKAKDKQDLLPTIEEQYNFVPNFKDENIERKGAELWEKLDRMESRYGGVLK